jgi:hypothetical protein
MSRLTALHVPFVAGHNDSVDPRVMPDGVFASVTNGRLRKSGSLAQRRGWQPLDMTEMATANDFVAHDIYSYGPSLMAIGTLGASQTQYLATYVESASTRPWRAYRDAAVPPVTEVCSVGNIADMSMDAWYSAYALTDDGVYGCALYQHSDGGPADAIFRVFRVVDDTTVALITDGAGISKIFSLGSTFGRVRLEGTNLVYSTLNPADTSPTFATVATLEAGITANSPFDVVVNQGATPTFLHTVVNQGGAVTYRRYSVSTGVQSGADKTIDAAGNEGFPAIVTDETSAHVLWKDTGTTNVSMLSFTASGLYPTTAGPTVIGTVSTGSRFCIGLDGGSIYVARESTDVIATVYTSTHVLLETTTHRDAFLVSGWIFYTPYAAVGIMRQTQDSNEDTGIFTYTDTNGPWLYSQVGTATVSPDNALVATPARILAPAQARNTKDTLVGGMSFAGTFVYPFTLAFQLGSTERRPAVEFGSTLYLTGGVLTQWSGNDLVENGMIAPVITVLSGTPGPGTIAPGTYAYRAMLTWFDELRGLHRSVVSAASSVVLIAGNDTVGVTLSVPKTLRRNANIGSNPTVRIFRTEEGPGELFYQVGFEVVTTASDNVTISDTSPDADILDQPRLYTEGEFGAVSGVLDIAPPRSSAYAAAMRDRIVLGSLGPTYQVSQTLLPEEPVAFAEPGVSGPAALAYFDSVEGALTAVATLDDTIVLGTADAIYIAGGEGPNLAGIGAFQSPARLPSDVGFFDWRSIIETSEGLWFLGDEDKLYLLPRGGGVPVFAGEAVQDRFLGEVVGCARELEDSIVAWALASEEGSSLIIHDIDHGYWFTDSLPFTPVALTTHLGRMYAVADDGVVWQYAPGAFGDDSGGSTAVDLEVETGHVQVFGLTGQGRVGSIEVLGEFQGDSVLELEISYDDGAAWTSLGVYSLAGAVGDTFQRQFYPANQRGGRFRLRLTARILGSSVECCRLTGFTVYYRTASGPSRLPSASRK